MTDGGQLLLVLILVYLSGCLKWVDRRTILFVSWFGGRWKTAVADYRWGNGSGRLSLLNPLPPLGCFCATRLLPVSISPSLVVAYNIQTSGNSGRPPQSGKAAKILSNAKFSHSGEELMVDGRRFCDIGDAETARRIAELLEKTKKCDTADRERAILEFWEDRLDPARTAKRMLALKAECGTARMVCIQLFFVFFAVVPLSTLRFGLNLTVLFGGAVMVLSGVLACALFYSYYRRHRDIFKRGFCGDLTKMLLCPLSVLRMTDLIMDKMSASFDPLPLSALLLRGGAKEKFQAEYLADLAKPEMPDGLDRTVLETCIWQNNAILKTWTGIAARRPLPAHQLPPVKTDTRSAARGAIGICRAFSGFFA